MTSSMSPAAMPALATAALIATPPRSAAASDAKSPRRPAMGVLAAATMTTGSLCMVNCSREGDERVPRFTALRRLGGGLWFARAPRAMHEFAGAVGANAIERIGAGRAERALVAADISGVVVRPKRPRTSLAAFAHFERHARVSLFRPVE